MGILNYTTEVAASKSVGEIASLLARKGAQSITQEFFEDGRVKAVSFVLRVGLVPILFQLPANTQGVAGVLKKENPFSYSRHRGSMDAYYAKQRQQAERIAWRILKDWVEVQVAMIESGQVEAAQVFMPYATDVNGVTVFERFLESTQKQLGNGEVA